MSKQVHVNINGIVAYEPSAEFSDYLGLTRLQDVKDAVAADPDADEIVLHINSPGGDVQEGFGIHDFLVNSGKKITTIIEARCYSIATVIALAGSARIMAKNAEFMIHNPWGGAMGSADDLQKAADWIRKAENQLAQFYVEKTGMEEDQVRDLMKKESFMSSSEALELKFITEVQEPVKAKAYAMIPSGSRTKHNDHLITIDMKAEDKNVIKNSISAICKKFNWSDPFAPKKLNLDYTIANGDEAGKTLHIETEATEPAVGDVATIEEAAAGDGTYEVNDGMKITCADGKVSSIEKPTEDSNDSDEVKALKAQLKTAQDELTAIKAEKSDDEATINAMKETLDKLEKVGSNYVPPIERKATPPKGKSGAFTKEQKNELREAINPKAK